MCTCILQSFRPLIRGFFFYDTQGICKRIRKWRKVSVPSFGDSFFISSLSRRHESLEYVSVPSFGDSFFIIAAAEKMSCLNLVSVPSFGDSFFMRLSGVYVPFPLLIRFRPLIRGFFFYDGISQADYAELCSRVSVPSFGDSFFIKLIYALTKLPIMVSVPSFGDSFFIVKRQC